MRGTARILALLAVVSSTGTRAFAADPPVDGDKAAAEKTFRRGQTHYSASEYDAAATDFENAYQQYPLPIFLYNAAQAHRLAGNDERALYFYKTYLKFDPKTKLKAEVQQHIGELERKLASETQPPPSTPSPSPRPITPPPSPPRPTTPPSSAPAPRPITPPPSAPSGTTTPSAPPSTTTPPPAPTASPPPSVPPPAPTAPPSGAAPATAPSNAAATPAGNNVVATAPSQSKPTYKKAWPWVLVGGIVVAGVVVGLAVGLTQSKANPGPPAISF